jgi:hypothetical protein
MLQREKEEGKTKLEEAELILHSAGWRALRESTKPISLAQSVLDSPLEKPIISAQLTLTLQKTAHSLQGTLV